MRIALPLLAIAALAACESRTASDIGVGPSAGGAPGTQLFAADFESGTLDGWHDGIDPARHRVVRDPAAARSGAHYLAVTYPAGQDGGWLTHFLPSPVDGLRVGFDVRFPAGWEGGTKLVGLYGSHRDDRWSAFGKAGLCPTGSDFFVAMLVANVDGNPGSLRFYTYYPGMAREPNGVTCWGRFGNGAETYRPPLTLTPAVWHHLEFEVVINEPGRMDGRQTFWADGTERGSWRGLSFRDTPALRLNAVQLSFSVSDGLSHPQELHIDNITVREVKP